MTYPCSYTPTSGIETPRVSHYHYLPSPTHIQVKRDWIKVEDYVGESVHPPPGDRMEGETNALKGYNHDLVTDDLFNKFFTDLFIHVRSTESLGSRTSRIHEYDYSSPKRL